MVFACNVCGCAAYVCIFTSFLPSTWEGFYFCIQDSMVFSMRSIATWPLILFVLSCPVDVCVFDMFGVRILHRMLGEFGTMPPPPPLLPPPSPSQYTMRNCETGDLSLIIRFTFYAFQMINVSMVGIAGRFVRSVPLQSLCVHKGMAQNLSCERLLFLFCASRKIDRFSNRLYNFRFIYIHH